MEIEEAVNRENTPNHSPAITISLAAIIIIQFILIWNFRSGLAGTDDMTSAFAGRNLVTQFDMRPSFTNQVTAKRIGMALPLGLLQLATSADNALMIFPMVCALIIVPLGYGAGRLFGLAISHSLIAAAVLAWTPEVVFNSTISLPEIPILVVTLTTLICFLLGLRRYKAGRPGSAKKWFALAGAMMGLMFTLKVSAVVLFASLLTYALLEAVAQRRRPISVLWLLVGFVAVLVVESGLWLAMTGDPLHRLHAIANALRNQKHMMVTIYGQDSAYEIIKKLGR